MGLSGFERFDALFHFVRLRGNPPLRRAYRRHRDFNDLLNSIGAHTMLDHLALHVGLHPPMVDSTNRARYKHHQRVNYARRTDDRNDDLCKPLVPSSKGLSSQVCHAGR
jgi:hypothetical protein